MNTTLKEETLGQRLKAARVRKNMTQEELAEAMLTTKSMISYYENDHGDMKQSMIAEFADVLGKEVKKYYTDECGYEVLETFLE